jgi:hypothetical protein
MTEKTSAAGWVVQLSIPQLAVEGDSKWRGPALAGAPTFQFYNVAITSSEKAIEAARKKAGAAEDAPMTAVRRLSPSEVAHVGLKTGEVRLA